MIKKINIYILLGTVTLMAGCSQERYQDLKQWMTTQEKGLTRRIDPLPTVKPFQPGSFTSLTVNPNLDPFKAKKVAINKEGNDGPGLAQQIRMKEPLEEFSLETLKMIGVMKQKQNSFALVTNKDGLVYTLAVGNHIGQNFGKITKIEDNKVILVELVQNVEGVWEEKENSLELSRASNVSTSPSTRK